jgi:hypothetical protein
MHGALLAKCQQNHGNDLLNLIEKVLEVDALGGKMKF